MLKQGIQLTHRALVVTLLGSTMVLSGAQAAPPPSATPAQAVTPAQQNSSAGHPAPVWQGTQLTQLSRKAELYYEGVRGVGELRVSTAESGEVIRLSYRVLDAAKAKALNDKKAEPLLFDAQAGVKLVGPQLVKVGHRTTAPEQHAKSGYDYWMAFSNPTLAVKRRQVLVLTDHNNV